MSRRWFASLVLLVVALVPMSARAGDAPPTLRLQIRSLDAVLDHLKLLVTLAGREEIHGHVAGLLKTKIGVNGLEGIDPARPFGAYGRVGKELNDVSGVVLVPIADEKAFLALLENQNFKATLNPKTGIYTVGGLPVELSFRFANKYAYITALNLEALDRKSLLPPERVFTNKNAAISAALRIDQLPDALKFLVKNTIEQNVQDNLKKKTDGTAAQKELRQQLAQQIVEDLATIVNEGQELGLEFQIDKSSGEMSLALALTPQGDTGLAKHLSFLGTRKSRFGAVDGKGAALQAGFDVVLTKAVKKAVLAVAEEARTKIIKDIRNEDKRKQADELLKSLAPTLESGELGTAFSFRGPNKDQQYDLVAAIRVRNGDAINTHFRGLLDELVKQIPDSEREKIKLDVETVAGTKIHRFDLGAHYDEKVRKIFGETPALIAVRDDAIFYALGPGGEKLLKATLANTGETAANPLSLELSLSRLTPLMAKTAEQRDKMQALFPKGDEGTIRFTVETGSALRARLTTRLSVVQFLGAMANMQKSDN